MKIEEFLKLGNGDVLSHNEAQKLNEHLAGVRLGDFSNDDQSKIADYLIQALNTNSVHSDLYLQLELLLKAITDPTA